MIYQFRDCELDTERVELRRGGVAQSVEPQVFRLLAHLIENRHRVVTRAELYDTIWNGRVVAEAALYSRIKSARSAIGDEGQAQARIRTVSRTGYQFVAEVKEIGAADGATARGHEARVPAAPPPPTPEAPGPAARTSRAKLLGILAGAASVAVAGYLLTRPDADAAPAVPGRAVPTIAVLPFLDMSPARDQEFFADGLTEEMTDHLSRIHGLRVVARTSAFAFKGKHEDMRAIASKLDAQHLLEGSVRRDGENLRITAQLIDASGKHIWSQTYDRKRNDIFAIQDEVAKSVATVLSVTVDPKPLNVALGGTRNLDAYDSYLAGRAALGDPTFAHPDKLSYSIERFRRATTHDPEFAYAWAWMAMTYYRGVFLLQRGVSDWTTEANHAAARAMEIAPNEPTVLSAAALSAMQAKEWAKAEEYFARARSLASTENPWACSGCFALNVGRMDDAIVFLGRAKQIEPLMVSNYWGLMQAYEATGRLAEADAEAEFIGRSEELSWFVPYRKIALAQAARDHALVAQLVSRVPESDGLTRTVGAHVGNPKAGIAAIRRVMETPAEGWTLRRRLYMANWAAYYDDPHFALELLRPALMDSTLGRNVWVPTLRQVRVLPEFKEVVREMKLVDYWRTSGNWGDFCKPVGADDFECR